MTKGLVAAILSIEGLMSRLLAKLEAEPGVDPVRLAGAQEKARAAFTAVRAALPKGKDDDNTRDNGDLPSRR